MSQDCNCCGCESRQNYRAHRVVAKQRDANVYEDSFAGRTSTTRDFEDLYDRIDPAFQIWAYSTAGDTQGPYSIECDSPWSAVTFFGPLTQSGGQWTEPGRAAGGDSTVVGVFGNQFSITFGSRLNPAAGSDATVLLEAAGFEVVATIDHLNRLPGNATTYRFPYWPDAVADVSDQTLASLAGTVAESSLSFDGSSLIVPGLAAPGPALLLQYTSGHFEDIDQGGWVTAAANLGADFPRAVAAGVLNRNETSSDLHADDPNVYPGFRHYAVASYPKSQPRYYPGPVAFKGRKVSVFRDDELVSVLTNPTEAQSLAVTTSNGSYLLVEEVDETSDPPWTEAGLDDRRRTTQQLKDFESFAIDDTAPIVGCHPPQDFYAGFTPAPGLRNWVNATKPTQLYDEPPSSLPLSCWSDHESDRAPRPYFPNRFFSSDFVLASDRNARFYDLTRPAGTYTVKHHSLFDTPYCLFGNNAASVPQFTATVHPLPPSGLIGPVPRLEQVGFQTREYFRARLQNEKVSSVELTFLEGPVDASGVAAGQITLTKDGEAVEGCTIAQVGPQRWKITVPTEPQTPGSFFLLTYDPAGEVLTDRNRVETYPSQDRFPSAADARYRVAYVDQETGKWFSHSPGGYVEIEPGSPPLNPSGDAYENEPVVCAARESWLMAAAESWPRPKDLTQGPTVFIGPVPSIGMSQESFDQQDGRMRFACSGLASIADWGSVRAAGVVDGFSPNCPADSPDSSVCSYFGLTTTIDPCPPKTLTCPAPLGHQRHSSAFRSNDEITSLKVSMVTRGDVDFRPPVWLSHILGRTIYGKTLPQNMFGAVIAAQAMPQDPAPVPFLNPPAPTYTVESGVVWAAAYRYARPYVALETATLTELVIEVYQQILVKETPLFGAATYRRYFVSDRLGFSREDEDRLLSGSVVEFAYPGIGSFTAPFRAAYWWQVQR